jgi:hypothetical protein
MADRWTDERDRDSRDRDWQRSERYGRGRDRDQDQDYGQQGMDRGREREDRSFDPRGGYDDDRGYDMDRSYGAEDRGYGEGGFGGRGYSGGAQGGGYGYGEGRDWNEERYGGRYQSGFSGGGQEGRGYRGERSWEGQRRGWQDDDQRRDTAARFAGPERDRVFGERETGTSYRPGATGSQGANYGGSPDYGREPGGRGPESGYGGRYGAYGSQGEGYGETRYGGQREYGHGGSHFGQPYGDEERRRPQDYRTGGRFYGDDGRESIYREEYGQGGREYGAVPPGYDTPQWRGGAESYGGRSQGWRGRDHDDHNPPNVREGRGDGGRSWWDRAKNQVASFFGDEEAERRSEWDRQNHGYRTESHRGRGPKGYKRSDDRISEEVHQRLTDDPWVDATHIDVEVKDCEVTLTGNVSDREERRRAERCVEDIWGVTHVQNNLRVQQQQGQQGQGGSGDNPREGAGSMLGRGSSDTSSNNPVTGTGHGFGDNMLAAGDPAAAGAASLTDAGNTGQGGRTGASSTGSAQVNKDRK